MKLPEGRDSSGNLFHFVLFRQKEKECRFFFLLFLPALTTYKYSQLCEKIKAVLGVDLGVTMQLHNTVPIRWKFLEIMEVSKGNIGRTYGFIKHCLVDNRKTKII